jgi:hypothetical protein
MAIPDVFVGSVIEKILNGRCRLVGGRLEASDDTRAMLVRIVDANPNDIGRACEILLTWELRLAQLLPLMSDPTDIRVRMFENEKFKAFFKKADPARVFAILRREAALDSDAAALFVDFAEYLQLGSAVILRTAIEEAAIDSDCREEIRQIFAQIEPGVQATLAAEMHMSIADRVKASGGF